ncbi:hypothetical protein PF003_g29779 [Phytophthora fragariae]|nr:hypothetical protein PF003_g29779 [Phytophthora fragariae]KAE8947702.1 hypothetical protein PF009_g2706 [Phytophthora fragariae]
MLRNLRCYVEEANTARDLTVGRPIMQVLGYSIDELLVRARGTQQDWQLGGHAEAEPDREVEKVTGGEPTSLGRVCRLQAVALDPSVIPGDAEVERHESRPATPTMTKEDLEGVIATLEKRARDAASAGLGKALQPRLREILYVRLDTFRLEFGNDPPVKVAPRLVPIKPGTVPTKAYARRAPLLDREFLERHVGKLLASGLVYRNPRSHWASAPRIVRKKEQDTDPTADPSMTIDTRSVNDKTDAMPWPMPILEIIIGELEGATVFFSLDWFRRYWQLPLHPDSQEFFTFITHRGMYTPTRVPMGVKDSVAYCQAVVEEIFGDLIGNGIYCWLDDILGYAKDAGSLMVLLDQVLERCEKYGLKLHAKKCRFYATEIQWCGKMISANGVRHCPDRIQGLVDMPMPRTAADLQQFLCAVNWMRQSIPTYNLLTQRLYATLETAMQLAGTRKKSKLSKFLLVDAGWGVEDETALKAVRAALLKMVSLAHPNQQDKVCLYTDASQDSWGAILTQLRPEELQLPLEEPPLSSTRTGTMARYQADNHQRWSISLMAFRYVIEHVPGDQNVWGDLLSRWGASGVGVADRESVRIARLAVVERVSPLQDPDFQLPSEAEIRSLRQDVRARDPSLVPEEVTYDEARQLLIDDGNTVWIPEDATELQQRLCIVAHAGAGGHRGATTTATALASHFYRKTLKSDVATFVAGCLQCMVTVGGRAPRPHGETLMATKPNELLHFDFLTMIKDDHGTKYVLVLKDGMSGSVELVACVAATGDQVYISLLDWFKRYGIVHQWVSDQGAHFKNQLIEQLRVALGAHHHFTTAYTPWANGTVEVVNREVLKGVKALLSEKRLHVKDWTSVLPIIQAALNSMPADRLGGVSPLTAFTALPGGSQLRGILHPSDPTVATVSWTEDQIQQHLASVRTAFDGMHLELTNASEKRRGAARERHAKKKGVVLPKFSEGDFVLAATATGRSGNKLALVWRGPKHIIKALNDYTFEVQDLVEPFALEIRHASRLQLYRDAERGRAEELVEQAVHDQGGHLVEALRACRVSPDTQQWEVQVKWYGLDELEESWEPVETIREDVPVLLKAFLNDGGDDPARLALSRALEARPTTPVPRTSRRRRRT